MSQNDLSIANAGGATVRADINSALQALATLSSGSTAPGTTYAGQLWWDTGNNLIKQRNSANAAWVTVASFDGTMYIPYRDGTALGTAATKDTGSGSSDIPTNDGIWTLLSSQSASGTEVDFTGIPSWAKRISVSFINLSLDGPDSIEVQIGDSGGFETSGYNGAYSAIGGSPGAFSSAFQITGTFGASSVAQGGVDISLIVNQSWRVESSIANSASPAIVVGAGTKTLSGSLDRVRVKTSGGVVAFDAGTISVHYQ
ncbi:hypothetical protein [Ferruginivarius sediminum]|uniref:Uncharacterized protein n=1 Tax=Ferruginivarius sediminum TaxID=2661937 RepID=A0A369TEX4_9PROT|nr:hypothetical protein [Ferruginivarius sediminum]RDD63818.1 hypothetical protein DRB17_01230 [Ferruginivarius sediminum]